MYQQMMIAFVISVAIGVTHVHAQSWTSDRADGHAPLGVIGDHQHEAGEWMLSFRYMRMTMGGNRVDTDSVAAEDVLADFPVTPLNMPMNMYMAGVMYAPSDRVTLMGMVPVLSSSMDHRTRMGGAFTTESGGLGDLEVGALVAAAEFDRHRVHVNLGLSVPSGSIDERDDTPAAAGVRLPYPMQVGSGTWDAMTGLTYLGQSDDWGWGGQGLGTFRFNGNDHDYALGDRLLATSWISRVLSDVASISARMAIESWGNVSGADPELNPVMVPTANPDLRGGTRVDLGVGLNLYAPEGAVSGHRLAAELLIPVYQNLDGPQLETDWTLVVGWQKSFGP